MKVIFQEKYSEQQFDIRSFQNDSVMTHLNLFLGKSLSHIIQLALFTMKRKSSRNWDTL